MHMPRSSYHIQFRLQACCYPFFDDLLSLNFALMLYQIEPQKSIPNFDKPTVFWQLRPASLKLAGRFYVYTAGAPAVCYSVLASSVIIVAARAGLLSPGIVPALGFHIHFPEHNRNAPCTNRRNCAGGVFRSQTARPEYNKGIALVLVFKGKNKGKRTVNIAAELWELQRNQGF